ncbi:MAG: PhnD/SsuA/transferrin family substrate-binding protein [Anaerolineae bacterium]|nr:PhnD/SsuA/transferrin family substrate-binding protein [Anaerolineae bacterium]MDW8172437.1 PhnD/SsuA/transferrin family substrate-binding protein [Anaerolineae bacterium]
MPNHKVSLYLLILLLVTACGPGRVRVTPTPRPTVTPFSTPLPIVPTALPLGLPDNPLRLALAPADLEAVQAQEEALEAQLAELSGVSIDLLLLADQRAVLEAVCGGAGQVSGLLGDLLAVVAHARDCAQPFLQLSLDDQSQRQSAIVFRVDPDRTSNALVALTDKTFCRLGLDDMMSWLIPSLLLQAASVQPTLRDVRDEAALRQGLASGTCDAVSLELASLSEDETERIAAESPPLPLLTWFIARAVPLEARRALLEAFSSVPVTTPTPTTRPTRRQATATPTPATQDEVTPQADSGVAADLSPWDALLGRRVGFIMLDPALYDAWQALARSAGFDWATLGE